MQHWWNGYPWRVIQPNFREIDTLNFDPEQFIANLKSFHCNTVMLNAAGIIASYPSKLPDHPVSPYIQQFNLKDLVDRCHQNGIRAIARTDFSKILRPVYERHPDWAHRTAEGEIVEYNGCIHTCLNGGYLGGYMDEILKELLTEIPFDGVYCNMGSLGLMAIDYSYRFYGLCHCENCKQKFFEQYHMDIPQMPQGDDPASAAHSRFRQEISAAQNTRVTQLIHSINPEIAYCSVDYIRQESGSEFGRGQLQWQYSASSNARAMRGMSVEVTGTSNDMMGFAYRHVAVSPALQELRLWQTLANFSGIDYYMFGRPNTREDQSAYERVRKVFAFAEAHEDVLYGVTSAANVLLVKDSYAAPNIEERGWIRVLTESHIPFDEILLSGLTRRDLSKYRLILLPDKARIPPSAEEALNAYVSQGGYLLESGRIGKKPLACLGIREVIPMMDKVLGSMLKVRHEDRAVFPSFSDRSLIAIGKSFQILYGEEGMKQYLVYLSPERFGPPELCYPTEAPTDHPGVTIFPYGKGKGICLPWFPATSYYQEGHDNWFILMKDILLNLCGLSPMGGSSLSPMVEITHGKKDDFEVVHFVNTSGHFGTSFFDPPKLVDQIVELPWDGSPVTCSGLSAPEALDYEVDRNRLRLHLKTLGFYECVVINKRIS